MPESSDLKSSNYVVNLIIRPYGVGSLCIEVLTRVDPRFQDVTLQLIPDVTPSARPVAELRAGATFDLWTRLSNLDGGFKAVATLLADNILEPRKIVARLLAPYPTCGAMAELATRLERLRTQDPDPDWDLQREAT